MILKPAWKLLIFHVQVYTEVIGYQQTLESTEESESITGFDSDEEDQNSDIMGVEAMT
jgi:hypothetical protein